MARARARPYSEWHRRTRSRSSALIRYVCLASLYKNCKQPPPVPWSETHGSDYTFHHTSVYLKVCRVHPHEFGVVRLCRTFSTLIFTGEMVVNGRLTKVNERAGSLQGQRMRVRVRQHVVGRLSVAVHIQCVPAVCHRYFIYLVALRRCLGC